MTAKDIPDTASVSHDVLLAAAFRDNTPTNIPESELLAGPDSAPIIPTSPNEDLTLGERELAERNAFRSVIKDTEIRHDELTRNVDVEYRKLRLEQVILVGVWTQGTLAEVEANMQELVALTDTAGAEVLDMMYQRRDKPDSGTFIGSGKVKELRELVHSLGADTVICDGELSPGQLVALENALDVKVIDRTMLILDIFAQHAKSKEGKAQVALAQMEYLITRVRGWGGSLSRQAGGRAGSNGGVGLRGPGETKIETDRRRLRTDMAKLRRELGSMKTSREIKRSRRQASLTPKIAIAGYTNAGKSSLINALTGAGVLVEDALFATLDPTSRRAQLADGRAIIFTDTVGFVRHLPTQLVEAFKSTLEEILEADLVIHVVDGSDTFPLKQIAAVNKVISEVIREGDAPAPPEMLVVNKIDKADPLVLAELRHALDDAVFVSAQTGAGIAELETRIEQFLNSLDAHITVEIPYNRGDLVAKIHEFGTIISEDFGETGSRMVIRLPRQMADNLAEFQVEPSTD
ncbi:GTPase HflX [Corynebacterium caspium]|uniref:GTPase HflX n=1 Tax=Corynebacterium caspium TaxID=234828 RepID=UPI00037F58EF|nr:GTPase HflX [Corynebacterium caspium]WKD59122.1 GTPase HflX [Corynebacterium caspium DSM 44850]